jgi:hypothetical protein
MSDELRDKIETAAGSPQRVRTDAGEVEAHDLEQMIAADKYLSAKAATSSGSTRRGLRFNKLIPPGAG